MLFRSEKMLKVNILLLARHVAETTRTLGKNGLLHLVNATAQSTTQLLQTATTPGDEHDIQLLQGKIGTLLAAMDIDGHDGVPAQGSSQEMPLSEITMLVEKISARYQEQVDALDGLLEQSGAIDSRLSAVSSYPLRSISLHTLHNLSRFFMTTGRLPQGNLPRATLVLGEKAIVIPVGKTGENVLVLAANKDRWTVKDQLQKLGFEEIAMPEGSGTVEEIVSADNAELQAFHQKIEECRMGILKLSEQYGDVLLLLKVRLNELQALNAAKKMFGKVSRLYCISGWTPENCLPMLKSIVETSTDGTGVLEVIQAEEDKAVLEGRDSIPVKLKGGPLAKAFQLLICNFGTPNYKELDPTVFVGITFTLFFGYMFGDLGQGLVLLLAGLWMVLSKKANKVIHDAGPLLIACGASAMCFGAAYGSIFGCETLMHHLWLNPLKEEGILPLLITAIGIGVVVSSVAVIINIINHFIAKKYFEGVFDRFGILGLAFYWIVLGAGFWAAVTKTFPVWLTVMILLPLLLLALRGPIRLLLKSKEESEGFVTVILECGLDLMETITGYMSGTISFVRIGAFAISHAALCMAVFAVVNMLKDLPGGTIGATIVIILGNLLIICFEGMVAMIQGIRLEYYELFGKFYDGSGVEYKPFKL